MVVGVAFAAAGGVLTLLGLAQLVNYRGVGHKVAMFGGALTFWFGDSSILPRPRRAWIVWGTVKVVIGLAWLIGGVALAAK